MTTDLLDRLVVPFLEEHEFNYSAEDDTITFNFSTMEYRCISQSRTLGLIHRY